MVFTERQKTELTSIVKEVSQKIVSQILSDKNFMESLAMNVADIVAQKLNDKVNALENKINTLETQLKGVQDEREELFFRLDSLEQNVKLNQLRLYGVPENCTDLKHKVSEVFQTKLGLTDIKVDHCYRIGKQQQNKTGKPRAIIIKFSTITQRNAVFFNKKKT